MANFATNKKANRDYEIKEIIEAGISLFGHEVKSVRKNMVKLDGSFVIFANGFPEIINMHITPYQVANTPISYDPDRSRKLLLNKKEILKIEQLKNGPGISIVPISLYPKGNLIKVAIGIGKGKKNYDKRDTLKKNSLDRSLKRQYGI